MKLTFKKHPRETGLAAVGNPHAMVDIKHNKKKLVILPPRHGRQKIINGVSKLLLIKLNLILILIANGNGFILRLVSIQRNKRVHGFKSKLILLFQNIHYIT